MVFSHSGSSPSLRNCVTATQDKMCIRDSYNGYRSLHLDVRVPVYLSNRTEPVVAEIQIRTIAMDFWASLEHDIHYKADRAKLPAGIDEEMFACAEKIAEIDQQMQDMYRRIADAEANGDAVKK